MKMASENTTIKISKEVQKDLKELKIENESYSTIIRRLLNEKNENELKIEKLEKEIFDLRMANNMLQGNIEVLNQQKERESFITNFNGLDKENQMAYMIIMKIATDIVPSADERVNTLVNNDFLTNLINDGKSDVIIKACELVKEQIKIGDPMFYDQLDIIDEYLENVNALI